MVIAQQKRKENIAEYILYMWQVEDTIRACKFDIDLLEERVISQYSDNKNIQIQARDWYANLILMMHEENKKASGHLLMLDAMVNDLNDLHQRLLASKSDPKYLEQYYWAVPNIKDFEKRLGRESNNEIDTCLSALYALLLLRLQKKKISEETIEAMQTFSNLLALLAVWYKNLEEGKAEI